MSDDAVVAGTIGWFGKLPANGDFLGRRHPDAFFADWDRWIRSGMARSASLLGGHWHKRFLTFPIWNFLRGQGNPARLWAGIILPSTDSAGRLYPLTLVFELSAGAFCDIDISRLESRLNELSAIALTVLEDDQVGTFDARLCQLAPFPTLDRTPSDSSSFTASCPEAASSTLPEYLVALGKSALLARLSEQSIFWLPASREGITLLTAAEPLQAELFHCLVCQHRSTLE